MADIKKIVVPGYDTAFDLTDANAVHKSDIASSVTNDSTKVPSSSAVKTYADNLVANLGAVLNFKGTKASASEVLALTSGTKGDVWLVTADSSEYVCTATFSGGAKSGNWEKLGAVINVASSEHTHSFSDSVSLSGTTAAKNVSVNVPTNKTAKYIKATAPIKTIGSSDTTNVLTSLGTPSSSDFVTGVDTGTVKEVGTITDHTINNITLGTSTSASKVTTGGVVIPTLNVSNTVSASKISSVTAGTAASLSTSVDTNGVLTISFTPNTPTAVSHTPVTAATVVGTGGIGVTQVTGVSNVTVPVVSSNTPVTVSKTTSSNASVVTGASKSKALTALGTPGTTSVVKSLSDSTAAVTISAGTSSDTYVGDSFDITAQTVAVGGQSVTVTGTISGTTGAPQA